MELKVKKYFTYVVSLVVALGFINTSNSGYDPERYSAMVKSLIETNPNFRMALVNNFDFNSSAKCSMVGISFMAEQIKSAKLANDENVSISTAVLIEGSSYVMKTFVAKGYSETSWKSMFDSYKNQFLTNQSALNSATKECLTRGNKATSVLKRSDNSVVKVSPTSSSPKLNEPVSCKTLLNQDHDDTYGQKMNYIAKNAQMTKGWNRNTEAFIYELCSGNKKGADAEIFSGGIQAYEAEKVAKILGIRYSAPERNAQSLLYEMTVRKLSEFMCSACAGNAAQYFVEHSNTEKGKLIKKAIDGDKGARAILESDTSWSSGLPGK
jgi:hypothetical protein